jgi:hypothetical protein
MGRSFFSGTPGEAEDADGVGLGGLEAGGVEDVPDGGELVVDFFIEDAADGDFDRGHFHAGNDARRVFAPAVEPFAADAIAQHRHIGAAGVEGSLGGEDGPDLVAASAGQAVGGDEAGAGGEQMWGGPLAGRVL